MRLLSVFVLASSLLLLSCTDQPSAPPIRLSQSFGPQESFRDLEAEYAAFTTQALTFNYLERKVHHWLERNNGEGMRREAAFARIKHPHLFKAVMKTEESICLQTLGFPEVQSYKDFNPDFESYTHEFICVPPRGNHTNPLGMGFNTIPAGSFIMGAPSGMGHSSNEQPQHEVQLSEFEMQRTEVTQAQWQAVMGVGNWPGPADWGTVPNEVDGLGPNYPMYYVNWCDIVGQEGDPVACEGYTDSFLPRLNAMGYGTYRLPTEAEWEYATRAGTTTEYACAAETGLDGNSQACLDSMGWYWDPNDPNTGLKFHYVARKEPNAWGLYDMHGNVRKWVQDYWGSTYYTATVNDPHPRLNPTGPATSTTRRSVRGGSARDLAYAQRSALRGNAVVNTTNRSRNNGFRLVRVAGN
jgi:formylglycine-generating enzyme required for sulfatase activity